jgi:serine protease Do
VDALIRRVSPSVVQILVTGYGPLEEGDRANANSIVGRQRAIGSGFVLDESGYIVTNAHVVSGAQRVQVVLPNPNVESSLEAALSTRTRIVSAQIVGVSKELDLAVIKVDAGKLPALSLADYRKLGQGEMVFAFGSPEGLRNSVTMGVVPPSPGRPIPIRRWYTSRPTRPSTLETQEFRWSTPRAKWSG